MKRQKIFVGADCIAVVGYANRKPGRLRAQLALKLFRMLGLRTLSVHVPVPASGEAQDVEVNLLMGSPS